MSEQNNQNQLSDSFLAKTFPEVSFGARIKIIRVGSVCIGDGSCIGDNTWINACQSTPENPSLRIGKKVLVGRRAIISSGSPLTIGDYCVLGPNVFISNADHGFQDIFTPILQQPITMLGELIVEENCWFGVNAVVKGTVTIGRGSVIGANSVVLSTVPPFSVVIGSPAKIIRMYNPMTSNWENIDSQEQVDSMLTLRNTYPCPTREELLAKLNESCNFEKIPLLLGGNSIHLDDRLLEENIGKNQVTANFFHVQIEPLNTEEFDLHNTILKLDPSENDGNYHNIEDKYDRAYRTEWESGSLRQLITLCYKTPDLRDNAIRYSQSEEFSSALSLLANAGHPANPSVSVLDIGCGNGAACWSLAKAGYQVTGIDSSNGEWAGVGAARKLINMDGVSFKAIYSLAEVLPFPPASFQVIWMREVLHHIKNLPEFLRSVKSLLVKDGVLIAMRDHVIWNEYQKNYFFSTHPFQKYTQDENCYYLNQYTEAFTNAGWQLELIMDPLSTAINTYPEPYIPNKVFSITQAAAGQGNSLYSFLARNPG